MKLAPASRYTETDVTRALETASLRRLAQAWDESAFRGVKAPDTFACPACGQWSAKVIDEWRWECLGRCNDGDPFTGAPWHAPHTTCTGHRTRLALVYAVGGSYEASVRLVELSRTRRGA